MKKSGQLIIGLILAFLAIYYTMRNVSVAEVLDSFRRVHYVYLIPTFLLMCLTYVARAVRWRALLLPVRRVETWDLFSPLMVGFMAGILPARAGELVRAYLLGKKFQLSFAGSLATIVVERLFDLVLLLLLFVWILIFHGDIFEGNISWAGISLRDLAFQFGLFSLAVVMGLVVFIFALTFHNEKAMKLVHWLVRPFPEKWQYKLIQMTETFSQGLLVFRNVRALAFIGLATAGVWALIVLQYYPLYWAYGLQDKSAASLILLTVMICILITVLPTPAFLGSFNAGVLIALHEVMQEAEVAAVSFGFVAWGVNFAVIIIGGVYFILHDHISVRKLVEIEEEG
ncbi:MAG: flippase-like domain-containing protein [Nitrospinaceae bacterium]|nr:flippase-like domain-containing protein [Nitrospinaceae bacterium]NIR56118.1 flippase-like domain-containing protein [Nitrospinaceae bacterium]NIS86566.1 flippase-like domain-containing protein [Nitrospinaceae bacterium]NIT83400.1 flippase-like domain-containing protein [Nitrospinaceae bacterium]NIU45610.1 flippase-like domain-containing protein [Nitrospinaceae bacterium]